MSYKAIRCLIGKLKSGRRIIQFKEHESMVKKIVWFTASYFIDVDRQLVPYIREKYHLNIFWTILQMPSSAKVPPHSDYEILNLHYRNKDPRTYVKVSNYLKKINLQDYDLIYSDALGLMYYTALLHYAKDKPVIHAAHNVNPYPVWPMSLKVEVKYIFHRCNYFQMFSMHTAHWFHMHYPHKSFFYAPMAIKDFGEVRTDHFHFDPSKTKLLFFGNIVANKRLDLLIQAVQSLPEKAASKIHLHICGKCVEKDFYREMIGNTSNITAEFRRIDDEEIPELFTKSDYLVLPYEDVAQSGPHMIAYNYNLPVIASDIDGFKERVVDGENGFLFKRNNLESLIETIVKVVKLNGDKYLALKERLRDYTETNYSVKSVAEKYIDYFNAIS